MGTQGGDGVVIARQVGFRQGRVDLAVTDLVQEHRLAALAAAQARDEMMPRLRHIRRDRAVTERAGRISH